MDEEKILTFGEDSVGLTFNPGDNLVVNYIKKAYASIIDNLNVERDIAGRGEKARLLSTAITQAEIACMCAVKGITKEEKPTLPLGRG
jgi:hypothetical protein